MKLHDMSYMYKIDALTFQSRVTELQAKMKETDNAVEADLYQVRIKELKTIIKQCKDLAKLTEKYYEKGYHKDETYTL